MDFYKVIKETIENRTSVKLDNNKLSDLAYNNVKSYFQFNGPFIIVLFIISIILFYASIDVKVLTSNTYYYVLIVFLPLLIVLYLNPNVSNDGNLFKIAILILVLTVVSITLYYSANASSSTFAIVNYLFYIVIIFIIIVGLALFYYISNGYLQKQTGTAGFIINFIFYIPCMFSEFIIYIKKQLGITPNIVYILFVIEIFLILFYIYIPKIINYYSTINSVTLLNDPVYLNQELSIVKDSSVFLLKEDEKINSIMVKREESYFKYYTDTMNRFIKFKYTGDTPKEDEQIKKVPLELDEKNIYRNNNYSFSFWVFVNPGSISKIEHTTETNIFNYANGKPRVTCKNDPTEPFKNTFIVYFTNNNKFNTNTNYEIILPTQKWNNFVFNYLENSADLFINGVLEKSFVFNNNNIPESGSENDRVVVGSNTELSGAICNVKYYTFPQTSSQIANNYNNLMFENPPSVDVE